MAPLIRVLAACLSLFVFADAAPASNANPTVKIASGTVIGTATRVSNQPSVTALVNAYLGVPFASPPERFSPPVAPKAWTRPLKAHTLPPACIQQFAGSGDSQTRTKEYFNNPGYAMPEESEDCLYLNVFAPRDASPTNKKPVLFWLFGGNLQFGTGSLTFYNGSSLAATQDIVVVTINYRTNIFGFSNSPEIPFGSQNSGFLDQRFALAWVTKNIATFGGDPSKVTLFGESAGGESVKQILAQPPSPLPFHGAILESQASVLTGVGSLSYAATVANFRCTTAASPIDCLRKVPATDIKAFIEAQSLAFTPVNNDGTSTTDVRPSIASKKFANVPILIGHNAQDAAAFLAVAGIDNGTAVLDNVLSALHLNESGIVDTILTTYGGDVVDDAYTLASAVATDALFTCPTASLSAYLTTHSYSVWRYLYSASFPNLQLFKCPKDGCAYHTSEIPLAWGTYPLDSFLGPATADEKALSKYMQGVWAGWAKNPKAGPGWPRVGTRLGHELGNIGSKKAPTGEHTDYLLSTDYPCAIYGPVDDALQLSYKV